MPNKDPNQQLHSGDIPLGVNWTEVARQQTADRAHADEMLDGIVDSYHAGQADQAAKDAASVEWDEAHKEVDTEFRTRMERGARIKESVPLLGGVAARAYGVIATIGDDYGLTDLSGPLKRRAKAERILDGKRR